MNILSTHRGFQIDVQLDGFTYKMRVDISAAPIKWSEIADTAYRMHAKALRSTEKRKFDILKVHSIVNVRTGILMDLKAPVRYGDLSSYIYPSTFTLRLEGPISRFPQKHMLHIIRDNFLSPKSLNALMRVSKKFNRLLQNDEIWENVDFSLFTLWQGLGQADTEDSHWKKYKMEKGLPSINTVRLRWLSHNTSRLRIYFGSIHEPQATIRSMLMKDLQPFANSVASYLGIPSSSPLSSPSNSDNNLSVAVCKSRKILLLGCQGETLAAQVMDRLFFVTPPTATSFIYNDTYKPLFSTAKLTKLEIPSYSTYHHRKSQQFRHADRRQQQQSMIIRVHEGMKNQVLEGMRIESDGILEYKCFGDSRLTFVQMESKPYSPQGDEFYDYFEPLQRVVGNILVIGYGEESPQPPNSKALSLYDKLHKLLAVVKGNRDRSLRNRFPSKRDKFSRYSVSGQTEEDLVPIVFYPIILVYVIIPLDYEEEIDRESIRGHIQSIVLGVHVSMQRSLSVIDPQNAWKYNWYVQPMPSFHQRQDSFSNRSSKKSNDLRNGFLAGMNWLIRTITDVENNNQD